MNNKILLTAVLFLSMLALPSLAWEEYSSNSYFTSNEQYLSVYNSYTDWTLEGGWNATYANMSGVILLNSNYSSLNGLWLNNPGTPTKYISKSLPALNATIMIIPPNKETLVSITYRFNATQSGVPSLRAYGNGTYSDVSTAIYNITELNATPNVWHNASIIINASSNSRYAQIVFFWTPDNPVSTLAIDKFIFYTYDIVEQRDTFFTTYDEEMARYCPLNVSWGAGPGNGTSSGAGPMGAWNMSKVNESLNLAYMVNYDTQYRINCCLFQGGNTTYGRRCWRANASDVNYIQIVMRDKVFITGVGLSNPNYALIHSISTYGATYDYFTTAGTCQGANYKIQFNGYGEFKWANTTYNESAYGYTMCNATGSIGDKVRASVLFNVNHSGSKWRNTYTQNVPFLDFFSESVLCDNTGLNCNSLTNQQYYVLPNCSIAANSTTDCGLWGCNDAGTTCDYGAIGAYCNADNFSWTATNITGEVIFGSCYPGTCYNLGGGAGVRCADASNTTLYCIDSSGAVVVCGTLSPETSEDFLVNPANGIAMVIGGVFGITDLGTAQNISSLVITIMVVVALAVVLGKFGGVHGKDLGLILLVVSTMLVVVFTMLTWLNPMIMILLVVLEAFMIAKLLHMT